MRLMGLLVLAGQSFFGQAIRLDPTNPQYFSCNGKPHRFDTSAEHYGAVLHQDFNYLAHLDALRAYDLNNTRRVRARGPSVSMER